MLQKRLSCIRSIGEAPKIICSVMVMRWTWNDPSVFVRMDNFGLAFYILQFIMAIAYADMECLLKVDTKCPSCVQKTLRVLSSIVGNLLGHGFGSHCTGGIAAVAPGILYLRVHRSIRDVMFMTEEIVSFLLQSVKDILSTDIPIENLKRPKSGTIIRYGEVSLSLAMTRIKLAASLGASLVWITGGLNLIQTLIKETLPCWFISVHRSDLNKVDSGGMISMLKGYALAHFTVLSGAFAWGVDSESPASKKCPVILEAHLGLMARALDGKTSLGCNRATWRAYVSGFVSLMVSCTPKWVREVDVEILRSLSRGLRKWDEEELALALLRIGGVSSMGAAA